MFSENDFVHIFLVVTLVVGWIGIVEWFVMIKRQYEITEWQTWRFIFIGLVAFTLFVLDSATILLVHQI